MQKITIDYQEYLHLLECKKMKEELQNQDVVYVQHISTGFILSNFRYSDKNKISDFIKNVEDNYMKKITQCESLIVDLKADKYNLEVKCNVLEARLKSIPNWIKCLFL